MLLDAIGIVAKDMNKTVEFYHLLGLDFQEAGSPNHLEATLPSGLRVMLDSVTLMNEINPNWTERVGNTVVLCFKENEPAGVDAVVEKLRLKGHNITKEPWDAFWGQRYASVEDPNGHHIDIFADIG